MACIHIIYYLQALFFSGKENLLRQEPFESNLLLFKTASLSVAALFSKKNSSIMHTVLKQEMMNNCDSKRSR
jgi:hypothetical protein